VPRRTESLDCQTGATLGNGSDLRVVLISRGAGQQLAELVPTSGRFSRRLDATSDLTMVGTVRGANERELEECCRSWNQVQDWATEIVVYRGGRDAWAGPVTGIEFAYGEVSVEAADLSAWWDRRTLPDLVFAGVDLADIFAGVNDAAMAPDPSPNIVVAPTPTGILGTRSYRDDQDTYAADALNELAETGVDWTAFGRTILVGGEEVPTQPFVTLLDDHFTEPPFVDVEGNSRANKVIVRGKGVRAVAEDLQHQAFYGLLVRVYREPQIEDLASCQAAADSRLELLRNPTFVDTPTSARLKTTAPVLLEQLIPGTRFRIDARATCRPVLQDFRLETVEVDFAGGVSVDFQPLGTAAISVGVINL